MKTIFTRLEDAVRVTVPNDPNQTMKNIIDTKLKGIPPVSYIKSRRFAKAVFSGDMTQDQIDLLCSENNMNDNSNRAACTLLLDARRITGILPKMCHDIRTGIEYQYGLGQALEVKPTFFCPQKPKIIIPWIQFRKNLNLTPLQLAVIARIIRDGYADDFDNLEVLIIDLAARKGSNERAFRHYFESSLPEVTDSYLEILFATYAEAIQLLEASGVEVGRKRASKRAATEDPDFFKKS